MTIKNRLDKLAKRMGVNNPAGLAIIYDQGPGEPSVLYNGKRYSLQEWEQLRPDPEITTFHVKQADKKEAANE